MKIKLRNERSLFEIISFQITCYIHGFNFALEPGKDFEIIENLSDVYIIRYAPSAKLNDKNFQKAFNQAMIEGGLNINYAFIMSDCEGDDGKEKAFVPTGF